MVYWTIYSQFPFYCYPIFSPKKNRSPCSDSTTVVQRRAADRHPSFDRRFTISSRYRRVIPCQLSQNSGLFPVHVFFLFFSYFMELCKILQLYSFSTFSNKKFQGNYNKSAKYIIKCAFLALRLNSTRFVAPNFLCRTKSLLDVIELH